MRHRQSRTIWSRKIAKELLSLEQEPRNMGEGSMGLSLGPTPSSASQAHRESHVTSLELHPRVKAEFQVTTWEIREKSPV